MTKASGCLFGLAYGDALGKPTEMTLAVAAALRDVPEPEPDALAEALRDRFLEWATSADNDRAPGNTCLRACAELSRHVPWQRASVTGSKGCGANMRVAPVGLVPGYDLDTFAGVAQLQAGLTHGHPTALAASELTGYAVRILREGAALGEVPGLLRQRCHAQRTVYRHEWLGTLWQLPGMDSEHEFVARGWDECLAALDRLDAALAGPDDGGDPCRYTGEGWIAEEALATGLWCAVRHAGDPVGGVARAAATSGDSDSIACLAGAFLGAAHGSAAWPAGWASRIEYADRLAAFGALWD